MAEPVPAPIFFGSCRGAIGLMKQAGMTDMMIADALIDIRAAAISEERLRVEWVSMNHPPHAGIRPQDILDQVQETFR